MVQWTIPSDERRSLIFRQRIKKGPVQTGPFSRLWLFTTRRSLKLAAFVALAGPLDLLVRRTACGGPRLTQPFSLPGPGFVSALPGDTGGVGHEA